MRTLGLFHRRLLFLVLVLTIVGVSLGAQLVRLAVVEGDEHSRQTASHLRRRTFLPFVRGSILDRRGEVLAADRASWDVQIEYPVIAGRWAEAEARASARRDLGPTEWQAIGSDGRQRAVEERLPAQQARVERICAELCRAGGIDRAELERRFDAIRARVAPRAEAYRERLRQAAAEKAAERGESPSRVPEDEPIAEMEDAHTILADVDDATAFRFQALAEAEPGTIDVVPATRREYPWASVDLPVDRSSLPGPLRNGEPLALRLEGVADHLLGSTRTRVFAEDLERRPFLDESTGAVLDLGGYRPDRDLVGARGLERSLEDRLRGLRGSLERDLETGTATRHEAVRGEDVRLTIDIRLQSEVQAALEPAVGLAKVQQWQRGWTTDWLPKDGPLPVGWELNGAAVVLEVETGDILALVTTPTLAEAADFSEARARAEGVTVNRPIEGIYPPGSIVKPLVYSAAVTSGAIPRDFTVECRGHYFDNVTTSARCWIWRPDEGRSLTHGTLAAEEAIARSCNIYFYTVAAKLGMSPLVEWFARFGVGEPFGIGVGIERDGGFEGESGGTLPSPEEIAEIRRSGDRSAPIFLGIGQGPFAWTPLHAAQAYATLARRGAVIRPSLLLDREDRGVPERDLRLDEIAVSKALEGLRRSIEEPYGTGNHITFEDGHREPLTHVDGVRVWGKTGTAQAPPLSIDNNRDGTPDATVRTDHAWFVGLCADEGAARPRYAIAVLVEYGGSGGKTAGPVGAAIIRALVDEGYLGSAASRSGQPARSLP